MTIEARLTLFGKVLSQSVVPAGKEYTWVAKDDGFGFWTWDEMKTRVNVLDDNSVGVSTEWESQRKKREKAGRPAPTTILHGEQVSGLKIPHPMIPGAKYELTWTPSNRK